MERLMTAVTFVVADSSFSKIFREELDGGKANNGAKERESRTSFPKVLKKAIIFVLDLCWIFGLVIGLCGTQEKRNQKRFRFSTIPRNHSTSCLSMIAVRLGIPLPNMHNNWN